MAACTAACGYCGRCTEWWERREPDEPTATCDECGKTDVRVTLAGLGGFCSRTCADKAEAKFTERMMRRGFMKSA